MNILKQDLTILRDLANQKAEISALPVNKTNIKLWTDANDLKMTKAPVYINELPWNEMNINDELTLKCTQPLCKDIENELRKELYLFKHMPANMVVLPKIQCPIVINDSDFGISEDVDIIQTNPTSSVVSRHFNIQISDEEDIDKIKDPIITIDHEKTNGKLYAYKEIFDGILEVEKVGVRGSWFTPWDNLVRWTGIAEAMMDLIDRPEYIDKLVTRYVDASISRLKQYNELGIWASNNTNARVGSGGYGYTSELPSAQELPYNAPTSALWGCGNAQIFSEVSPNMHWEFSLKHELRWLENFGLNYYGCCEPLHNKMDILAKIPNLRKISTSPWAKIEAMREAAQGKYVLSCKPTPAIFAGDNWSPEQARADILDILNKSKGCSIELILKDISTVNYKPQRLWEWSKIALDAVNNF